MKARSVADLVGAEAGQDVYVVGTGTSLAKFDFSLLAGKRTIALNDACLAFNPSYLLFTDYIIHRYLSLPLAGCTVVCPHGHHTLFRNAERFAGKIATFEPHERLKRLPPGRLYCGHTVAVTGVYLAWVLGARRIFLLGIDAYRTSKARYWDGRVASNQKKYKVAYEQDGIVVERHHLEWCRAMSELRAFFYYVGEYLGPWPGPGVYNLSERSTIDCVEKVSVEKVLG